MTNRGAVELDQRGDTEAAAASKVAPLRPAASSIMVVIPARDEAAAVGGVVRGALAVGLPVVVVDDHSSDRTAEIARRAGATVLQLPFHSGAWAAIQAGMRYAREAGCEYVVTLDADGQHNPEDIATLLEHMDAPEAPNVVIGACIDRANRRRRVAWRVLRWLSGLRVQDLTSGFRVYDRDSIELLSAQHQTLLEYQDVGVLLCLRAHGLEMREIEVGMSPRTYGISRIFRSWPMVIYYLIYSTLIGSSRRGRRIEDRR